MAIQQIGTLTIPAAGSNSNELSSIAYHSCVAISIHAPATLTGAITLESADEDVDGATFDTVQSPPGTDIAVAAGKSIVLTDKPWPRIRLHSAGVEAAERVFAVWGEVKA